MLSFDDSKPKPTRMVFWHRRSGSAEPPISAKRISPGSPSVPPRLADVGQPERGHGGSHTATGLASLPLHDSWQRSAWKHRTDFPMTSPDNGGPTVRIGAAEWRTRVRDHDPDRYRGATLHVALLLGSYMDRDGSGAYPSIDILASRAGRRRGTVISALKTLETDGFLVKQRGMGIRGGSRGPKTTRYSATVPTVSLEAPRDR